MENIKIGEIEIPNDYFKLTEEEKRELCIEMMDVMLTILDKNLREEISRIDALETLLVSSIITNQKDEKYEICGVLNDIRKILNEQTN